MKKKIIPRSGCYFFLLKNNLFQGELEKERRIHMTTIIGVNLTNRAECSAEFQQILTKYGCSIRTRIGLHHSEQDVCLNRGIVLLDLKDDGEELIDELSKHWEVQTMKFE